MARVNKKVPRTVTYGGHSYERVQHKATVPETVTFKGTAYKRICADKVTTQHPWIDRRNPENSTPLPFNNYDIPLSPVQQDIFVRMSTADYQLLLSLPQAIEGPLHDLLERARSKKLDAGRAEVMASEDEVKVAIAALKELVQSSGENPEAVHAQDMLSTWKRNYVVPDKPLSKPLPTSQSELPPSSNLRMFHYKGAKYVLVRADEAEPKKDKPSPKDRFREELAKENAPFAEGFAEYFGNMNKSVKDATPLAESRKTIDELVTAVQTLDNAVNREGGLNWKKDGLRMMTDAFYSTDQNRDNLLRLLTEEGLIDKVIGSYVTKLNEFRAALKDAEMASKQALDLAVQKGWTSKWAATKETAKLKKELLQRFYGMNNPDEFIKKFYHIPDKKEEPSQTEASVSSVPRAIEVNGHRYVLNN